MSLAMLTATALLEKTSLAEAQGALEGRRPAAARQVLDVIFQLRGVTTAGKEEDARLRTTLLDLWSNPTVRDEVARLELVLWEDPDDEFAAWVCQRYAASLAQALRSAMIGLAPEVDEDELW